MSTDNTSYKNLELHDSECLLLQFRNERKKPIQIGFQAWLKDVNNITDKINKEVIIHWPDEIDIMCAKAMKKKLKSRLEDKWIDIPVKILAIGGKFFFYISYMNL